MRFSLCMKRVLRQPKPAASYHQMTMKHQSQPALLLALVELKRDLAFPLGNIAASTSGKSEDVNPAGTNGSARIEGGILQISAVARFGGVDARLRGVDSTAEYVGAFGEGLERIGGGVRVLAPFRAAFAVSAAALAASASSRSRFCWAILLPFASATA